MGLHDVRDKAPFLAVLISSVFRKLGPAVADGHVLKRFVLGCGHVGVQLVTGPSLLLLSSKLKIII